MIRTYHINAQIKMRAKRNTTPLTDEMTAIKTLVGRAPPPPPLSLGVDEDCMRVGVDMIIESMSKNYTVIGTA